MTGTNWKALYESCLNDAQSYCRERDEYRDKYREALRNLTRTSAVEDAVIALRAGERILLLAYTQDGAVEAVRQIAERLGSEAIVRPETSVRTPHGGYLRALAQTSHRASRGFSVDRFICLVDDEDLNPDIMAAIRPCLVRGAA